MKININKRDLATILAALRCYQDVWAECDGDIPERLADIATNGGAFKRQELDEINDLCTTLNFSP